MHILDLVFDKRQLDDILKFNGYKYIKVSFFYVKISNPRILAAKIQINVLHLPLIASCISNHITYDNRFKLCISFWTSIFI